VHVHLVVREHETDTFVLADALAEGLAPARIVERGIVRAANGAEPAHAMRESGWGQTHLCVVKTPARSAEDILRRHMQIVEANDGVTAREAAVQAVHDALDHDARRCHVGQEHRRVPVLDLRHDDRQARADRAGDEPLAAVDHVVIAMVPRGGLHHRGGRTRRLAAAPSCRNTTGCRPGPGAAATVPCARASRPLRADACCLRQARRHSARAARAASNPPPRMRSRARCAAARGRRIRVRREVQKRRPGAPSPSVPDATRRWARAPCAADRTPAG